MIGRSGCLSWSRPGRGRRRPRTSRPRPQPPQSMSHESCDLLARMRSYRRFYTRCVEYVLDLLLSEEFFDLLHPGFGTRVVSIAVYLADRLELAQQLPLSVGRVYRRFDNDVTEQIAVFPTAHTANTLARQPKYLPRLSLGGDSDLRRTVQRGDFNLSAERRRRETDRHFAVQVVVVALKNRSEEHTSELQSRGHLVCRLLL